MGEPGIALRALFTAACVAALGTLQLPAASGAGEPSTLRGRAQELRGQERAAWLSAVSLGTRIEQTQAALERFRLRRETLGRQRTEAELALGIARRGLAISQKRLAGRLRALYEQGETDPLAVLLGAGSLDEAITSFEGLERTADQDRDYAARARSARARLVGLARKLAAREAEARQVEEAAEATLGALAEARRERTELLASLAAQRRSNATAISSLESRAGASAEPATRATPIAPPVTRGGRALTVTATGYALPGRTATGVAVGYGIVAVDPSVIALGTRMTIPGYGEGVAADTGGAVIGNRIDLWFPTDAEALAWGTRTVTVTLH